MPDEKKESLLSGEQKVLSEELDALTEKNTKAGTNELRQNMPKIDRDRIAELKKLIIEATPQGDSGMTPEIEKEMEEKRQKELKARGIEDENSVAPVPSKKELEEAAVKAQEEFDADDLKRQLAHYKAVVRLCSGAARFVSGLRNPDPIMQDSDNMYVIDNIGLTAGAIKTAKIAVPLLKELKM